MADDEKDRLLEKLHDKRKGDEDRFFAERDREALQRLRSAPAAAPAGCPRCGAPLERSDRTGVTIDRCPARHGIWLDEGELELIAQREREGWIARLLGQRD